MSKFNGRFFLDNSIAGAAIRLSNNQPLRSRNNANSGDIELWKIDTADKLQPGVDIDMNSKVLTGLPDPSGATDAARKSYVDAQVATKTTTAYVDSAVAGKADTTYVDAQLATKATVAQITSAIQGLAVKSPVRAATNAALPANTYSAGVLTATANGALAAVDGVTLVAGDRVLVKNESTGSHNGIYDVTTVGDGSNPYVLTRSSDSDTGAKLKGAFVYAQEGTVNADFEFLLATDGVPTLGTTSLTWSNYGTSTGASYTAGDGILVSGTVVSAKTQGAGTANTTGIDGGGNIKGLKAKKEALTLSGTDITNGYVDLAAVAHTDSIQVQPEGGPLQKQATDYTLSYTGGAGGVTRVTFAGDLSTLLASSDVLLVSYQTL